VLDNTFDVTLSKLRGQVDRGFPTPYLRTIRDHGYMLTCEPTEVGSTMQNGDA
jgi:DNA-binding response OmpR family regulator